MTEAIDEEEFVLKIGRDSETGLPRWLTISDKNGKLHSPTDDHPAWVLFDDQGRPKRKSWHYENRYHRKSNPALLEINPDNAVIVYEQYNDILTGQPPPDQIAFICRDPATGKITDQATRCEIDGYEKPPSPKGLEPN